MIKWYRSTSQRKLSLVVVLIALNFSAHFTISNSVLVDVTHKMVGAVAWAGITAGCATEEGIMVTSMLPY